MGPMRTSLLELQPSLRKPLSLTVLERVDETKSPMVFPVTRPVFTVAFAIAVPARCWERAMPVMWMSVLAFATMGSTA